MEIAKNRIIGLLKIIDHLDKENKTLRDANINGYKKYERLRTMYLSRSAPHGIGIGDDPKEVKDEKEDI